MRDAISRTSTAMRLSSTALAVAVAASVAVVALPAAAGAASAATYYVDPSSGSDTNPGTSPSAPWRSLDRVTSAALVPGDAVLLRRGSVSAGTLRIDESGTSTNPISVGAYDAGASPVVTGGCIRLSGSHLHVSGLHVDNCTWAGVEISGSHAVLRESLITRNVAGVHIKSGSTAARILRNNIRDNNRMSVNTVGGDDDSGAFGVALLGDNAEIAYNTISGSDAASYDYGRDGAAVEVYGGVGNRIHHNTSIDNDAFSELGHSRSADNVFAYNVVRSSLPDASFLVTRGADSSFGPVTGTVLENNSVHMTGATSKGFVCHGGCDASVLRMRNNVLQVAWKVGYADAPFDEDYNLYSGGQLQFERGPHSIVAGPAFVSASSGDLRLSAGSPAVDRGVPLGWSNDMDGAVVPQDGDGDGSSVVDLGAYERVRGITAVSPSPSPIATVPERFSDGFETGDFSRWTGRQVGGDGTAVVQSNTVRNGSWAARLSASRATGSHALVRKELSRAVTSIAVEGDFRISTEGVRGGNVPLLRLFDPSGRRLVSAFRQNSSRDRVYVQHSGAYHSTSGKLPLNRWARVSLVVTTAGASSTVQLMLDGKEVYRTAKGNLGTAGVLTVQIGNDTSGQQFTLTADNVNF